MSTQSFNQTIEIALRPEKPRRNDEFLANYIDEQKKGNANDMIWICLALSVFGLFVFGIAFQLASLAILMTCLFRRRSVTRGGAAFGMLIGFANVGLITFLLYNWMRAAA